MPWQMPTQLMAQLLTGVLPPACSAVSSRAPCRQPHPARLPSPARTRSAASFLSISAALMRDRHSCGRQKRLCTAMLRRGRGTGGARRLGGCATSKEGISAAGPRRLPSLPLPGHKRACQLLPPAGRRASRCTHVNMMSKIQRMAQNTGGPTLFFTPRMATCSAWRCGQGQVRVVVLRVQGCVSSSRAVRLPSTTGAAPEAARHEQARVRTIMRCRKASATMHWLNTGIHSCTEGGEGSGRHGARMRTRKAVNA